MSISGRAGPCPSAQVFHGRCVLCRCAAWHLTVLLSHDYWRYVVTIAKKYLASGTAFEDLLMAGSLGITKAADKFDASLGYRFISFATWYIECEVRKAAYDNIKHNSTTVSLDEPIYADKEDSDTMMSRLVSSTDASPDWHVRYEKTFNALKSGLDKHYWLGAGEMLDEYISMMEKGYTTTDFARKFRLNEQEMCRFLDMVRTENDTIHKESSIRTRHHQY